MEVTGPNLVKRKLNKKFNKNSKINNNNSEHSFRDKAVVFIIITVLYKMASVIPTLDEKLVAIVLPTSSKWLFSQASSLWLCSIHICIITKTRPRTQIEHFWWFLLRLKTF